MTLNSLAEAAAAAASKADRHRRWEWCRLWNGFIDLPIWRVVAQKTGLPLTTVQAFVVRLDNFANGAEPRGWVGHFNADEFGAAHNISTEEAARLFATLCEPEVGWVDQEYVTTFWRRNPDKEDGTVNERQRRTRARRKVRELLAQLVRRGAVEDTERNRILVGLEHLTDQELLALKTKLANAALSTGRLSHVTLRDIVTVTPRADQSKAQQISTPPVDNSGTAASGESQGSAKEPGRPDDAQILDAEAWLKGEGIRIVVERMGVEPPRADTLIQRWRRDLEDCAVATAEVLRAFDTDRFNAAQFQVQIGKYVERVRHAREFGSPLPLPPVALGPSTGRVSHVTCDPVDIATPPTEDIPRRSGTEG